jgi:hypothetical protein
MEPDQVAAIAADIMAAHGFRCVVVTTDTHVITVEELGLFAPVEPLKPPLWGFAVRTKEIDL